MSEATEKDPLHAVKEQIKTQFKKAFDDLLEESLKSDTPDIDWLCRLYEELRTRICNLTPRRKDRIAKIYEDMDLDFFRQLVSHNVFDAKSMDSLINYVFHEINQLESPARNDETQAELKKVLELFHMEGTTLATFAPVFLRSAHSCINKIYEDKQKFLEQFKK